MFKKLYRIIKMKLRGVRAGDLLVHRTSTGALSYKLVFYVGSGLEYGDEPQVYYFDGTNNRPYYSLFYEEIGYRTINKRYIKWDENVTQNR